MTRRVLLSLLSSPLFADNPLRVLIVTGGHDHQPSFYSLFDVPEYHAVVDPHPKAFSGDLRKRYDVAVLYDMVQELDDSKRGRLKDFVEAGKGVVVLHHAICGNTSWRWWYQDVVGGRYLFERQGEMPPSTFKHDEKMVVHVSKKHPVTNGLSDFTIEDETYKGLWISPSAEVLLTTDNPTSDGPLAWIGPHPTARVVYIQLGHGTPAHRNMHYRRLVHNAVAWAGRA